MTFVADFQPATKFGSSTLEKDITYFNGTSTINARVTVGYRYKSPTVQGVVVQGFKRATPYSRIVHKISNKDQQFVRTERRPVGTSIRTLDLPCPTGPDALIGFSRDNLYNLISGEVYVSSHLVNKAIAEARVKLAEKRIDLGVMLGEARQTLGYLAGTVTRLVQVLLLVKAALKGKMSRTSVRRALRAFGYVPRKGKAKAAAGWWLEWQYAIKPLLSDVYAAMEVVRKGLETSDGLFSVTRTVKSPKYTKAFQNSSPGGMVEESAKCTIWGRVDPGTLRALGQVGLINPLSVLWELVPFSFVIDWLLPIGTLLESSTATLGVQFVDSHVVKQITGKYVERLPPYSRFRSGTLPEALVEIKAMQRVTYDSFPWPFLYIEGPLSTTKAVTALALLTQLRK